MRFLKKITRFNFPYILLGFFVLLFVYGMVLFTLFLLEKPEVQQSEQTDVSKISSQVNMDALISRMSLEEKVGQILILNYYGDDEDQLDTFFEKCHPGGIMLKGENTYGKSFNALRRQITQVQKFSRRVPLWISVDQEGGSVSRLKDILKRYAAPSKLFRQKGLEGVEEEADYYAEKLKELGIQINFSPVLDVVKNSQSIIADRSFSDSAMTNALLGKLYVQKFRHVGEIAVPKHFPGYGNIVVDPHDALAVDNTTNLDGMERAFEGVLDADLIMISHVIYENFDSRPATLSPVILERLRKVGFTNLIISDDIQMKSITLLYDYDEAAIKAIQAGCDVILSISKDERHWVENAVRLHSTLVQAYRDERLSQTKLDERVKRILEMKFKSNPKAVWGLLTVDERSALGIGEFSSKVAHSSPVQHDSTRLF